MTHTTAQVDRIDRELMRIDQLLAKKNAVIERNDLEKTRRSLLAAATVLREAD